MSGETNAAVTAAVARVWSEMTTDRGDVYAFLLVVLGAGIVVFASEHSNTGQMLIGAGLLGLRLKK